MSMQSIILGVMAIRQLQPIWAVLHRAALGGMGFMNCDMNRNGEYYFMKNLVSKWNDARIPSPLVLDVGANRGEFTKRITDLCPRAQVHAFEAVPSTAKLLTQRFCDNKSVIVCGKGISNHRKAITLFDSQDIVGSTHASIYKESFGLIHAEVGSQIEVECETIDNYISVNKINNVDLMKIDIEGSELAALEGASKSLSESRIKVIQLECNLHFVFSGLSLYKLTQILKNYDIYRVLSNGLAPLVTKDVIYNSRQEIYKFSNLIAVLRGDAGTSV